jgi:hypothetical protein
MDLIWKRVDVGDSIPPPRRGAAAMTSMGDAIYIYGGYDESGSCFSNSSTKNSGV